MLGKNFSILQLFEALEMSTHSIIINFMENKRKFSSSVSQKTYYVEVLDNFGIKFSWILILSHLMWVKAVCSGRSIHILKGKKKTAPV